MEKEEGGGFAIGKKKAVPKGWGQKKKYQAKILLR